MKHDLDAAIESHNQMTKKIMSVCPDGPWNKEPNRVTFKAHGLDCILARNMAGAWCGYVGLPKDHPLHGMTYSDLHIANKAPEVHGGITYSEECQGAICHRSEEPEDRVWWLGFDCSHLGDLSPALGAHTRDEYRDVAWVKAETERLAEQLAKVES